MALPRWFFLLARGRTQQARKELDLLSALPSPAYRWACLVAHLVRGALHVLLPCCGSPPLSDGPPGTRT